MKFEPALRRFDPLSACHPRRAVALLAFGGKQ